jgi:hypothetical protein
MSIAWLLTKRERRWPTILFGTGGASFVTRASHDDEGHTLDRGAAAGGLDLRDAGNTREQAMSHEWSVSRIWRPYAAEVQGEDAGACPSPTEKAPPETESRDPVAAPVCPQSAPIPLGPLNRMKYPHFDSFAFSDIVIYACTSPRAPRGRK